MQFVFSRGVNQGRVNLLGNYALPSLPRLNNNRFLYIWHHMIDDGLVLNDNANKYDVDNEEEFIDSIYIKHKTTI